MVTVRCSSQSRFRVWRACLGTCRAGRVVDPAVLIPAARLNYADGKSLAQGVQSEPTADVGKGYFGVVSVFEYLGAAVAVKASKGDASLGALARQVAGTLLCPDRHPRVPIYIFCMQSDRLDVRLCRAVFVSHRRRGRNLPGPSARCTHCSGVGCVCGRA